MNRSNATATFYGATDTGRVRNNNEDNFIACEIRGGTHILLAAIDGIGGYEGGEVAARIARDVIVSFVNAHPEGDCLEVLKQAVTEANNTIVAQKKQDSHRSNMGCVLSSAIISLSEKRLYMVHIGDSRLYRYSPCSGLTKLSHDHSLVGFREEIGMLTEDQAMKHPQRNIIERSLGDILHTPDDENYLDSGIFPIFGSTQFLLCSDGLSDMVYSADIAGVLSSDASAHEEVARLIDMANDAGGKDNITAVIAKLTVPEDASGNNDVADNGNPCNRIAGLPPADNRDDLISAEATDASWQATSSQHYPDNNSSRLTRFKIYLITAVVTFLAGGTVGFFIGVTTGEQQVQAAIEAAEKAKSETDSIIMQVNNPTDTIAEAERLGEQTADSINRLYRQKTDSARTVHNPSTTVSRNNNQ